MVLLESKMVILPLDKNLGCSSYIYQCIANAPIGCVVEILTICLCDWANLIVLEYICVIGCGGDINAAHVSCPVGQNT